MGMDTADAIRRAAFWFQTDLDRVGSLFDGIDEADVSTRLTRCSATSRPHDPNSAMP
jgi:hypothetical protein